ncbi:Fur family transcriptional regulator [Acidipila sp. EB88]|uniref:Fur family transcriptional regulator n=1 Tax=Acidipila sp. EB88 TaxID=2305226 RepID=UPI000F5F9F8E|nr:transcriptional repressor [Acidipila sp. EB88]RRA49556.1 transcriptional repressor [Acidipila sp. EB88]
MTRRTQQKQAIWAAFETATQPLSVHEVRTIASRQVKHLSLATVYRTIGSLLKEGSLSAIEVPGNADRYRLAGANECDHFRCDHCGCIYEIAPCPLAATPSLPAGFRNDRHQVFFFGVCFRCCESDAQ